MSEGVPGVSPRVRLYIATVVHAGTKPGRCYVWALVNQPVHTGWLILPTLTLLAGAFSIKLPSISARVSVSDAFVFAAVLLFGPPVATVIVALDSINLTSWKR